MPSGRQNVDDLIPSRSVSLLGQSIPFSDVRKRRRRDFVTDYLQRCHYTAHIEKQDGDGDQEYPAYVCSAFGFECDASQIPGGLTADLRSKISWPVLGQTPFTNEQRAQLYKEIIELFSRVGGDTRRPTNEITLWEWSHTVAALYKSALVGALLGFRPQMDDLRWRLLSIRFDGFTFFADGHRLPDLLARQELLHNALDKVRELLEIEYPLGTEIYRDENGSIFVVPGCEKRNCALDVLALSDDKQSLRAKIQESISCIVEGEIVPELSIDEDPWWGQDPARRGNDELPPVSKHLAPVRNNQDPQWIGQQWNTNGERCSVCEMRPQGPSQKAKKRNVCDVCERRRADRSKEWAQGNLDKTIWTNEVADANGRLALIAGQFDITHWLKGTLIQSLTVATPSGSTNETKTKNASFARIRRIWETTRMFWQNWPSSDTIHQTGNRLQIIPADAEHLDLGYYHVYDLILTRGVKLSVVWDEANKRFITAENLEYLSKPEQLGEDTKSWLEQRKGQQFTLEEPTGYGSANKVWGEIEIQDVAEIPNSAYTPAIPILAEPRTFMALVPADKALAVVDAIKTKYEREMGKVRNRLPLHLGIVYAHRRTPLRAVLDAGRRMLQQSSEPAGWKVTSVVCKHADNGDELPPRFKADAAGQFKQWYEISLERNGDALTWYVPAVMGDGTTEDRWYPYVYLNSDTEPSDRQRYFEAPNPWTQEHKWLVHAGELKEEDIIYFAPATLDIQWLDAAGRRFEIAYDDTGKRLNNLTKPYVLDDLENLDRIWETLFNHLSKNQIYAIRDSIETKRDEWQPAEKGCRQNGVFWRFCRDVLANAQWQKGKTPDREGKLPWEADANDKAAWLDEWAQFAANGWLVDVVELRLQIMKEEPESSINEGVVS